MDSDHRMVLEEDMSTPETIITVLAGIAEDCAERGQSAAEAFAEMQPFIEKTQTSQFAVCRHCGVQIVRPAVQRYGDWLHATRFIPRGCQAAATDKGRDRSAAPNRQAEPNPDTITWVGDWRPKE